MLGVFPLEKGGPILEKCQQRNGTRANFPDDPPRPCQSMRVPFLVVVGGYSSWIGQVILLFRRDVVIRCFEDLSGVSDALEADDGINPRNVQARANPRHCGTLSFL